MRGMTLIVLLCGVAVLAHCCRGQDVQYKEFKDQPGIYLEEVGRARLTNDEWRLVLHYNLTNYWGEWHHMRAVQTQLEQSCQRLQKNRRNNTDTRWFVEADQSCGPLMESIRFLMEGIEDRNTLLRSPTRRRRAPLEFVGTFMSEAFGVMDQRAAVRYEAQIEALQAGSIRMGDLIRQQTHVLDVTTNLVRKQQEQMKAQYKNIYVEIQSVQEHADFTDAALQIITHITLFKETQEAMIEVMTDLHQGHINTKLITPSQLKDQLQQLKTWIPSELQVPDYQKHWVQLFKLLRVRSRLIGNLLLFELSIPLLGQAEYQIFKVYMVPTPHESRMMYIQPSTDILLVDLQRTWYYSMTATELAKCQAWGTNLAICTQREAIYLVSDPMKPCELRLLQHEPEPLEHCKIQTTEARVFVSLLSQINSWIVSLAQPETVDIVCNRTLQHKTIQGSGILTLASGCTVRSKNFILRAHSTITSEQQVQFLPSFNISERVAQNQDLVLKEDPSQDIQEMMTSLRVLHAEESWTTSNVHDLYHYASSGGILILLLATVLTATIYWKKRQKSYQTSQTWQSYRPEPAPAPSHSHGRRTSI